MDEQLLRTLLTQPESANLEFKRAWYGIEGKGNGVQRQIKNISTMANPTFK